MSRYVHIHLCFPCDSNVEVAKLAKKHLDLLSQGELADGLREAKWFLEDLSQRTGGNAGPKGGLSLWGMVGNYTLGDEFCETLSDFWVDLLSGVSGGPLPFERVVVFVEPEQSGAATAYQIGFDETYEEFRKLLIVKHEALPFSWCQH